MSKVLLGGLDNRRVSGSAQLIYEDQNRKKSWHSIDYTSTQSTTQWAMNPSKWSINYPPLLKPQFWNWGYNLTADKEIRVMSRLTSPTIFLQPSSKPFFAVKQNLKVKPILPIRDVEKREASLRRGQWIIERCMGSN